MMKEIFDKDGNKLELADLIRDHLLFLSDKYGKDTNEISLYYIKESFKPNNEYIFAQYIEENGYDGFDVHEFAEENRLGCSGNVKTVDWNLLWSFDKKWGDDYVLTVDGVPAETVLDVYHETSVAEILEDMKENGHELASNEAYIKIKDLPESVRYFDYYSKFVTMKNKR